MSETKKRSPNQATAEIAKAVLSELTPSLTAIARRCDDLSRRLAAIEARPKGGDITRAKLRRTVVEMLGAGDAALASNIQRRVHDAVNNIDQRIEGVENIAQNLASTTRSLSDRYDRLGYALTENQERIGRVERSIDRRLDEFKANLLVLDERLRALEPAQAAPADGAQESDVQESDAQEVAIGPNGPTIPVSALTEDLSTSLLNIDASSVS